MLKVRRKNFGVRHIQEAGQMRANLCGDGIVAFAMPPQDEFGLLFEVL
jgi:hypothetical protein